MCVCVGLSIVRWDVRSGERVWQFQAHKDVVTSMRRSHDLRWVATSCYSGEVKLWNEEWRCVDVVTAPMGCQHHVSVCACEEGAGGDVSVCACGEGVGGKLPMYTMEGGIYCKVTWSS